MHSWSTVEEVFNITKSPMFEKQLTLTPLRLLEDLFQFYKFYVKMLSDVLHLMVLSYNLLVF